jgi:hypothetical protein
MLGARAETLRAARSAPVVKAVAVAEGETHFSKREQQSFFFFLSLQHLYLVR